MRLAFIKEQIIWVDKWTNNLVKNKVEEDFNVIESMGTSLNWQIGHIIVSKYFHAIQSVVNKEHRVIRRIEKELPMKDMLKYYFAGSNPLAHWKDRLSKDQLMSYFNQINEASLTLADQLTEEDLKQETEMKNPIAKTKYDALTFVFKHQMWHNGQIAMMKRIIKK